MNIEEIFVFKPVDFKGVLIFGEMTPFFISLVALLYMVSKGGVLKGLYGSLGFNLIIIIITYWLNSTYNLNLDLFTLVLMELFLIIIWVFSLLKTT